MISGLLQDIALGAVRHIATASGGWLMAHGYLANDQLSGWIGSLCFLAGIAWSAFEKIERAPARA